MLWLLRLVLRTWIRLGVSKTHLLQFLRQFLTNKLRRVTLIQVIGCWINKPSKFSLIWYGWPKNIFHLSLKLILLFRGSNTLCFDLIKLSCLGIHQLLHFLNLLFGRQELHGHILVLTNPFLVWLILSVVVASKVLDQIFFLAVSSPYLALRDLLATIVFDEWL